VRTPIALLLTVLLGCSSEHKKTQADCDAIETQINTTAAQKSLPTDGICNRGLPDFQQLCADLAACINEVQN
jgi:hypothetical protein